LKRLPPSSGNIAQRALVVVLTLAVVAGLVWGVKRLGDSAQRGLAPRDRYTVRFLDIECDAPPGLSRAAFLSEVRYHSHFPPTFQSIDPELRAKLSTAFAAHPWVAAVERVVVEPEGRVRVEMKFRIPALAFPLAGSTQEMRVVDTTGVLLPITTNPAGLPELLTPVPATTTPSGQPWPDRVVKRALELVGAHQPRKLEKTPQGWRLTKDNGTVLVIED